jgi:hypothetical protein
MAGFVGIRNTYAIEQMQLNSEEIHADLMGKIMPILTFGMPMEVSAHFTMPLDNSHWDGTYLTIPKQGRTPNRDRAGFQSWRRSLIPITDDAKRLATAYGVYLVAVSRPYRALYVGIAAGLGHDATTSTPEGMLKRLQKHRVKLSGTHVGPHSQSVGGVNHTSLWRGLAQDRALSITQDDCRDVRFVVGRLRDSLGAALEGKADLERFEARIARNHLGVRNKIADLLWLADDTDYRLLTKSHRKLFCRDDDEILLWLK